MTGTTSTGTLTLPSGGHIYFNKLVFGSILQIATVAVGEGVSVNVGVIEGVFVCVNVNIKVGV